MKLLGDIQNNQGGVLSGEAEGNLLCKELWIREHKWHQCKLVKLI